jgi:hypothetical protein
VLAHLATGIGNQQRDATRIAGAGVDDHQCIADAAMIRLFCLYNTLNM